MVAQVIEKVTSVFDDEPNGGRTIRKKYPNGYYDFFPDPKDYTFEEYLLAVEEYTVLHVQKKRADEAALRASTEYEFKELFKADRVECPTLSPDGFSDVFALKGGLSQDQDV